MPGLAVVLCALTVSSAAAAAEERPVIRASDVVFMYASGTPSQYDAYSGTVVGWGGRPRTRNPQDVEGHRARVEEAHKRGMRYCGSVDFLVDFGGFIDFRPDTFQEAVTRDLDGKPLRVPWLWDHEHKGSPAYWFCTNNPDYQAYLHDQAERACLAPIDGLHLDDYSGSSASSDYNGGCFCTHCMDGFRAYLADERSPAELRRMEIPSLESFHYGEYLKSQGITAESYKREHWKVPHVDIFQRFQNACMKDRILSVYEHAERLRGRPLLRSINSSASSPRTLVPAPVIDYFCGEVPSHASAAQVSLEPIFVFKTVEFLRRRQTATAAGQDWAWIKANDKPGLVRMWVAQTYALGSVFMAPHNQWCYTKELGTHWWHGKPEDFAYLYKFAREHSALLDDYVSLSNTGLVYSAPDYGKVRDAALRFAEANIPYACIVGEHDELPPELAAQTIATFEHLVALRELPGDLKDALDASQSRVVRWENVEALPEAIKRQASVTGPGRLRLSLRYKPGTSDVPVVCHVLNQNYDLSQDGAAPVDVRVSIHKDLLKKAHRGSIPRSARVHMPRKETQGVIVAEHDNEITFEVKNLGLWAIVEL